MNIIVLRTGYVDLVVGGYLAKTGDDVLCAEKIEGLPWADIATYEPGHQSLVRRNLDEDPVPLITEVVLQDRPGEERGRPHVRAATGAKECA